MLREFPSACSVGARHGEASRTPKLVALNDAYLHSVWGNCGYFKGEASDMAIFEARLAPA